MAQVDSLESTHIAKIFVVCDRNDSAPAGTSSLWQQGLRVILEPSIEKAIDRGSKGMPGKARICSR